MKCCFSGWLCVSILSVFLVAGCAAAAQDDDPNVGDMPLSACLKQLRSENRGLQVKAAKALSAAQTNLHARIVGEVSPLLRSERGNDRFVAAQVLGEFGAEARSVVPNLLPLLDGTQYERNRAAAAKALGLILKDAKPDDEVEKVTQSLIKVFEDKYSDVRREGVTACGMIGPAAKACIPMLAIRLNDAAVPRSKPWLDREERLLVDRAAAWTMGRMGPLAACHIDLLIGKLQSDGSHMPEVVDAIGLIGPVQDNVVPSLAHKLEKATFGVRQDLKPECAMHCLMALERFGAKSAGAVELLMRLLDVEQLRDKERTVQVLKTLQAIGAPARSAVGVIEKNVLDLPDVEMKKAAEAALRVLKANP